MFYATTFDLKTEEVFVQGEQKDVLLKLDETMEAMRRHGWSVVHPGERVWLCNGPAGEIEQYEIHMVDAPRCTYCGDECWDEVRSYGPDVPYCSVECANLAEGEG